MHARCPPHSRALQNSAGCDTAEQSRPQQARHTLQNIRGKGRRAAASSERGRAAGWHQEPTASLSDRAIAASTRLTADTAASCLLSCLSEIFHNKFVRITTMGQAGLQGSVQKGQNSRHTVHEQHTPHSSRAPAAQPGQAWTSHSRTAANTAGPAPRDGNK